MPSIELLGILRYPRTGKHEYFEFRIVAEGDGPNENGLLLGLPIDIGKLLRALSTWFP